MIKLIKNKNYTFSPARMTYLGNPENGLNQAESQRREKTQSVENNNHIPPIPVYETELLESSTNTDSSNKKKKETTQPKASSENEGTKPKEQDLKLPERPKNAMNGTQFSDYLKTLEETMKKKGETPEQIKIRREKEIYQQVVSGNIPESMRQLKTVKFKSKDSQGKDIEAEIKVMPDYLSVGSDKDAIRVPMTPATAQLIASHLNCSLPTDTIVDKIAEEAKKSGVVLAPKPKPASEQMVSTQYFIEHNEIIKGQLEAQGVIPGTLIAGDKKDIVLPKYNEGHRNVAIYGWHNPDLSLIQGYSNGQNRGPHEVSYADYSHGVRLISRNVKITYPDGHTQNMDIDNVLRDSNLYKALSNQRFTQEARNSYPEVPFEHTAVQLSVQATNPVASQEASQTGGDTKGKTERPPLTPQSTPSSNPQVNPSTSAVQQTGESAVQSPQPDQQTRHPQTTDTTPITPSSTPAITSPSHVQSSPSLSTSISSTRRHTSTITPSISQDQPSQPTESTPTIDTSTIELPPIQGSLTLLGDSILSGLKNQNTLNTTGDKKEVAKLGITTKQLLSSLEDQSNIEKIEGTDNVVVLIGTNDIGANGSEYTADAIFDRINQIWQKVREKNANAKIVACTIPPFKGHTYGTYGSNFEEVNNKRKEINEKIKASSNPPDKIIDLCLPYANGGLASSEDNDEASLDSNIRQSNNDPVHPSQSAIAELIQRNLTDTATDIPLTSTKHHHRAQTNSQNNPIPVQPTPTPTPETTGTTESSSSAKPEPSPQPKIEVPSVKPSNPAVNPIETTLVDTENETSTAPASTGSSKESQNPSLSNNEPATQALRITSVTRENPQDIAPSGYKRATSVSPAAGKMASTILSQNNPKGTVTYFEVDGKKYAAKDTTHQHAETDNVSDALKQPHHGVTVFVQEEA